MQSIFDPLNIILLAAAVFVLWRFGSVLGQRTGNEKTGFDPFAKPEPPPVPAERQPAPEKIREQEPAAPIWKGFAEEGSSAAQGLEDIAAASPGFTPASFLDGAKIAYEMVLESFAKGDKTALKPLLAREVYDSFSTAIDQRQKAGQKMIMQFVGVKSAKIFDARLEGKKAQVAVDFVGEMISATVDQDDNTIDGDPKLIRDGAERWTFERDVNAKDPNWKLVDTSGDNA
jgi:predicted lipid-binding transport protein (Tim44 family)